ncbi:MAG: anthranilate synthase component I family protein [Ferruginibacter sp.]
MKNNIQGFAIEDCEAFKLKMLSWTSRFNIFCFMDNNNYAFQEPRFQFMLAAGCLHSITIENEDLESLQLFHQRHGWLFGHFGYDLLNKNTSSTKQDEVDFPAGFFFAPQYIISFQNNLVTIECNEQDPEKIFQEINHQGPAIKRTSNENIEFNNGISKEEYISTINTLKKHILRGDCYEINFCQHFYESDIMIDPLDFYHRLTRISPNPFSAFYKIDDKYCLCASPERFLKRSGGRLISQPIKGTSKRDFSNIKKDDQNKKYLLSSEKEKSENVMIVDLVRNDLSKIAIEGTVEVKELFGIYSFPQVHQMISTIECDIERNTRWIDIIRACFPMGSMTGAPKKKVMELISRYEKFSRGLFSGSIGYIDPSGDFDFNVVIRSLMYNETKRLLTFKVGSGITFNCDAEKEYEECMMKAEGIRRTSSLS